MSKVMGIMAMQMAKVFSPHVPCFASIYGRSEGVLGGVLWGKKKKHYKKWTFW